MKKVKLPQMHLACADNELRPSMSHVEITKENVTASDAHVLITHKTEDIFSKEFIVAMPDKFYIHQKHWAQLCKPHLWLKFKDGLIEQQMPGYKNVFKPVVEPDWKYPAWEKIMPNKSDRQPIDRIGINPALFNTISKALFLPGEINRAALSFFSESSAILITVSSFESKAILMPMMLNSKE